METIKSVQKTEGAVLVTWPRKAFRRKCVQQRPERKADEEASKRRCVRTRDEFLWGSAEERVRGGRVPSMLKNPARWGSR